MTQIGITDFADAALDASWRKWINKGNPAILITKNIQKLLDDNPYLLNQNVIVHATITGYGGTFIEPGVPSADERLNCLATLSDSEKERIVVRIDPIIPLHEFVEQSLKVRFAVNEIGGFKRIRVSVLDLYPHVLKRLDSFSNFSYDLKQVYSWDLSHSISGEHKEYMQHASLNKRLNIINQFKPCEVCAEPGIHCTGCISSVDLKSFGIKEQPILPEEPQRLACSCLANKKELLRSQECRHSCLYCYMTRTVY